MLTWKEYRMAHGKPSRFSMLIPTLLICSLTLLLVLVVPSFLQSLRHENTLIGVQAAGLRLQAGSGPEGSATQNGANVLAEISNATSDLADFVRPSVVHLTGVHAAPLRNGRSVRTGISTGSGWLWDDAGHVVTNFHVVDGVERLEVQLYDGEIRSAAVIGADPSTDIAVLKISDERLIPASRRSSGDHVQQGELCFAFGSPFDLRFSMSSGIVSGLGRAVSLQPYGFENFIQVDAAINPGNSGGPLTDHMGRVIGMNTAIATNEQEPDRQQFGGIGLAIPLDMIESVVEQVIDHGMVKKGFLGVTVLDQDNSVGLWLAQHGFRGRGVLLSGIEPEHPAFKAGLQIGDVVTRYDGNPISNEGALRALLETDLDEQATVRAWRSGDAGPTWVELKWDRTSATLDGLIMHDIMNKLSEHHRAMGCPLRGVLVSIIQDGKPAQLAGLLPGDIIVQVNLQSVLTVRQLQSKISSIQPGQSVRLDVWRFDHEVGAGGLIQIDVELARLGDGF
jgi:serine protease Do